MPTLPTNIVRQGEPSRSALGVASLRAVHQLLDELFTETLDVEGAAGGQPEEPLA